MRIEIRCKGLPEPDMLGRHVRRRLQFALSRLSPRIERAVVRCSDLNGPRGGVDKLCRILVKLRGLDAVVVEETAQNVFAAIDRAADTASRSVGRRVERQLRRSFAPVR